MSGEPEPAEPAEERKPWHRRARSVLVAAAVIAAAWIGFLSDVFGIHDHFFPPPGNNRNGPAVPFFAEPLATAPGPGDFRAFLKANDGRVVRLDTSCLPPQIDTWVGCRWHDKDLVGQVGDGGGNRETLVEITDDSTCDIDHTDLFCARNRTLLEFEVSNATDAEVDNGKYGAGNLVFHGYFAVHYDVGSGTLPPDLLIIRLTGVNPSSSTQ